MFRSLLGCAILGVSLFVPTARSQTLDGGRNKFWDSKEYRSTKDIRRSLRNGAIPADPNDKDHVLAIDLMAREYVYQLYWTADGSFPSGKLSDNIENFMSEMGKLSSSKFREKSATTQQMLTKAVIDRCKEMMPRCKPLVAINVAMMLSRLPDRMVDRSSPIPTEKEWAAMVLPRLAQGNGNHLVTVCLALLDAENRKDENARKNPKAERGNSGVRYYLFKTISSTMGVPFPEKPLVEAKTEEAAISMALDAINKDPKFPKNTPRDEVEGFKVLRREALKIVAKGRTATVGDKAQVALALARFAAGDERIVPEPRVDERMEAAIGLSRLIGQASKSPGFHADYAVPCVVRAVQAFGLAANTNIEKSGLERARPWKVEAARFLEAIERMKGDGKDKYLAAAHRQCRDVLTPILTGGTSARVADLNEWLTSNPPTSKSIYRGVDESTVKLAESEEK